MDYKAVNSLATMFFDQADALGHKPFLWAKKDGAFQAMTYSEAAKRVSLLALGLRAIGVRKGDRVVLVSENRPDWVVTDLAICALGAVSVPAYTTNTTDDHQHILEHSGAKAVIVSTARLASRLLPAARMAGDCEFVVAMDGLPEEKGEGVQCLSACPFLLDARWCGMGRRRPTRIQPQRSGPTWRGGQG